MKSSANQLLKTQKKGYTKERLASILLLCVDNLKIDKPLGMFIIKKSIIK